MHVGAGESFRNFLIGYVDSEFVVFFLKEFLCEQALHDSLRKDVVAVIAALIAELLACLGETVMIILVFHCHTCGFSHSCGGAEIGAS